HQIEAQADLMRALDDGQVVAVRPAFFHARDRHPVRHAETGIAGDANVRKSALPRIRSVRIWNAKLLPEVSAEIIWRYALALPLVTEDAIQDDMRGEGVSMADCSDLNQRVAQSRVRTSQTGTARNPEYGLAARLGPHATVLAPDRFFVAGRVID